MRNLAGSSGISEDEIPEDVPEQLNLFTDYAALERQREAEKKAEERKKRLQKATLLIQERYGKNAMLKGMNLREGATTIQRNGQIGGHAATQPSNSSSTQSPTVDDNKDVADTQREEDWI